MFISPNVTKLKFKKFHKNKLKNSNLESKMFKPKFGFFSIRSVTNGKLKPKHVELGRRLIRKIFKKDGIVKINVFPFCQITKKPVSARMGKGKGKISGWFNPVKKGKVLFEVMQSKNNSQNKLRFKYVFQKMKKKFPIKIVNTNSIF